MKMYEVRVKGLMITVEAASAAVAVKRAVQDLSRYRTRKGQRSLDHITENDAEGLDINVRVI